MQKLILCSVLFISSFLTAACKVPEPRMSRAKEPMIRIGIMEEKPEVQFEVTERTDFRRLDGSLASKSFPPGRWRVEVISGQPAAFEYRLSVGVRKDRAAAERVVTFMAGKGLTASIQKYNLSSKNSLHYGHDAVFQVLLEQRFKTEDEAKQFARSVRKQTSAEIVRKSAGKQAGTLRFTRIGEQEVLHFSEGARITAARIGVAGIDVGKGFHWERSEHRTYGGTLEFRLDETGQISVVNELLVENYLKGVVPSEMPAGFPFEALKAQAVAARAEAFTRMGVQHPGAAFDLCDDVHCQVYSGLSRQAEATDRAVEETRGTLALHDNEIIEAFYSAMSGGHTENNENVWNMDPKPYLRGILDKRGSKLSTPLSDERHVKKWIDGSPDVHSNVTRGSVPSALNYGKKYFRWQVDYTRQELESILRKKTGEDFGQLRDLRPVKRGVSGRLIELEVIGSKKSFSIGKELAIRQALSNSTLYSACFYVKKSGFTGGAPAKFILRGAGWGHGVGMCQIGAAMMAHSGQKFDNILKHYYRGIYLKKLYN